MNYRKVWEEFNNEKIPPGYHIHHIDGNHNNNNPSNLLCVSPEEHWRIHYEQGDIVALYGRFIQGASDAGKIGGSKGKGKVISEKQRKRHSEKLKEIYKERGSSWNKGRKCSDETKERISNATKGENNPIYGTKRSDEVKSKISNTKKQKFASGELVPHSIIHTEKTKKKISDGRSTFFNNGGISPYADLYDVIDDRNMKLYENKLKRDILVEMNLSDREFLTVYAYCKRNNGKLHPKFNIKIISKGKYYDNR